ncbi:MAG: polyprenol monophosphomannose synthase [Actinobacteria bacterium]|nr:polyprenol monophosphomannose synthase [Actinomycetota bacterium]
MSARSDRRIVVVPTYQERETLPRFLAAFERSGFEALVVDDGSPDGTGEWAEDFARERPWLHVLRREGERGLGGAYRAGFAWCLERDYFAVGQMDCDLSHPVEALEPMWQRLLGGADLVLGSRFVRGGRTVDWPWWRKAQSYAAIVPARLLLHTPVSDLTGGFKLWRAEALRRIEPASTISQGYVFQIETTRRAFLAGLRVEQVPIVFREREQGDSKMSLAIKREGVEVVLRLRRDPWRPG